MSNFPPILIPIKAFSKAKMRLSPELDGKAREQLARKMAAHVVTIAKNATEDIFVVCEDESVAKWAKGLDVEIIWSEGCDLNASIELSAKTLLADYAEMIVAHSDLPEVKDFGSMLGDSAISLAPDRHKDGTNVLRVPLNAGFKFHYGKNSFELHLKEAKRLSLEVEVVERADLALDIDVVEDLGFMQKL